MEVIEFIKRRFPTNSNWCTGNCYWFAVILTTRFPNLSIWYAPITGHFVAGDGVCFYDWHGEWHQHEPVYKWEDYEGFDPLQYKRIVKGCIC